MTTILTPLLSQSTCSLSKQLFDLTFCSTWHHFITAAVCSAGSFLT